MVVGYWLSVVGYWLLVGMLMVIMCSPAIQPKTNNQQPPTNTPPKKKLG